MSASLFLVCAGPGARACGGSVGRAAAPRHSVPHGPEGGGDNEGHGSWSTHNAQRATHARPLLGSYLDRHPPWARIILCYNHIKSISFSCVRCV